MLHILLVESCYRVCNISVENFYLINSDKNQITSTKMRIRQPSQFSFYLFIYLFKTFFKVGLV